MTKTRTYYVLSVWLNAAIGLLPVTLMATSQGGSALFYVLILGSLVTLTCLRPPQHSGLKGYGWLTCSLLVTLVAVLASQTAHHFSSGSEFERAGRLILGVLVLLAAFRRLDPREFQYPIVGVLLAAWIAAATVAALSWGTNIRPETEEYNAVGYGNLLLLFGVFAMYSLACRLTRHVRIEAAIKIATSLAACYGFVLTQTRTGWMAVPVFVLVGVMLFADRAGRRKAILSAVAVLVLAAAFGASNNALRSRIENGFTELKQCEVAPLTDSSMCIRLQLWGTAWQVFKEQPLLGIGGGRAFEARLQAEDGRRVSHFVATNFGEAHSDLLYTLATTGILGGTGLLLAYFAPAWIFVRRLTHQGLSKDKRAAAAMGLALCLGFAVFGLTELMFRGMRTISFYAVFVAWLLAASDANISSYLRVERQTDRDPIGA